MPFLVPTSEPPKEPKFYIFRSAAPRLGVSFMVQKMAQSFLSQNKKVLIFDALLGLKNFPATNKNAKKIPLVLQGIAPLTEIITQDKGLDVITGIANQTLTALDTPQQHYIKMCLRQLSKNYDVVLIDMPFHVTDPIWQDLGENLWVVSPEKRIILNTLSACQTWSQPHLLLNTQNKDFSLNQLYPFIKMLKPDCQITTF